MGLTGGNHLLAHFEAPHLAEFFAVMQHCGPASRAISRYYVSSYGPNRT